MNIMSVNFVKDGILNKKGLNYLGVEITVPKKEGIKNEKKNAFFFIIDNSGSMDLLASDKRNTRMYYAKQAVKNFINALDEEDKVGIVTFTTTARKVLTLVEAKDKEYIYTKIDGINAESSTNMGAGLELARELLTASDLENYNCKFIVLSDGEVNCGLKEKELVELSQKYLEESISLTSLGIGDSYNSKLMNDIATGLFYHIDKLSLLDEILSEELKLTNGIVYNNAKLILKYKGLVEVGENLNDIIEKTTSDARILSIGNLIGNTKKRIVFELKNELEKEQGDFEVILELSKEEKIVINKSLLVYKDKEALDKLENNEDLLQYIIQVLKRNTLQQNTLRYMETKDMNFVNRNVNCLQNTYDNIIDTFGCSEGISYSVSQSMSESHGVSQGYSTSTSEGLKNAYCSFSSHSLANSFSFNDSENQGLSSSISSGSSIGSSVGSHTHSSISAGTSKSVSSSKSKK